LKKINSPKSFYIALYLSNPPSNGFHNDLEKLTNKLIQIFGK
jgi:hypothetical protein